LGSPATKEDDREYDELDVDPDDEREARSLGRSPLGRSMLLQEEREVPRG